MIIMWLWFLSIFVAKVICGINSLHAVVLKDWPQAIFWFLVFAHIPVKVVFDVKKFKGSLKK